MFIVDTLFGGSPCLIFSSEVLWVPGIELGDADFDSEIFSVCLRFALKEAVFTD